MKFGENLKRIRASRGMTQTELANSIGITQGLIGHIERGVKIPSLGVAIDIAKTLNCSLDELCSESSPQNQEAI